MSPSFGTHTLTIRINLLLTSHRYILLMAKCKRDKCTNTIGSLDEEKKLRICHAHHLGMLQNRERRQEREGAKCLHCGVSLQGSRNRVYCSKAHRTLGQRVIDDDYIVALSKYSYWRNIESLLKGSPIGLGSINGIGDVVGLFNLYRLKSRFQQAYNVINDECVTDKNGNPVKRLVPWLELELCHRYPNAFGGYNNAANMIIGPAIINRMVKDTPPKQSPGSQYNGMKSAKLTGVVKTTLLKALKEEYGASEVKDALVGLGKLEVVDIDKPRPLRFRNTLDTKPLFTLLEQECARLRLKKLSSAITLIKNHFKSHDYYYEFFAVACFHSILTGDKEGFLHKVERLSPVHEVEQIIERDGKKCLYAYSVKHRGFAAYCYGTLDRYLKKYFHIEMHDMAACYQFYNQLFSFPPVQIAGAERNNEIRFLEFSR